MDKTKMTAREWINKALYEGSVEDGFEYGLKPDDLADEVDPDFRAAVVKAYSAWSQCRPAIEELETMIDELEADDDES